ncbi:MAG: ATP-binding protein [Candidatus Solibacter sp.]
MEDCRTGREISEFLLRACHDLRTPARTVRTYSELIQRGAGSGSTEGVAQHLSFLMEGARKIDVILDGLAGYSLALQTDPGAFQKVRMDIQWRAAMMKLAGALRECGGEATADELPEVTGQPERLLQLLENLVRNSLVHRGEAAPRIHLNAVRQEAAWLFTLRDNGPGIEEACLESIFLPFERLRRDPQEGAGLGLTICREIVERHGGKIRAEAADSGACFRFTLTALV